MKQIFLQSISKLSLVSLIGMTMLNFYIAPPTLAADGDNLIVNPSLETETVSGQPDSWMTGFFPEGLAASFNYPVEGSGGPGTKAAKTTITAYGAEGDAKWYFTDVPVTPETYYIFSDKYKANIASKIYIRYNLGKDVGGADIYNHVVLKQVSASTDWAPVISEFLTPAGVVSLTIFHVIEGVGELTVDDYSLVTRNNPNAFPTGIITFTFDDGWQSVYDNAIPILDAKGYKSTQYIITDVVQNERVGSYMTPTEILQMYNIGHDIAAHTRTHTSLALPPLSSPDLQKEVAGSRYDLLSRINVKPADTLAYTYGDYDEASKIAVKDAGFLGARTIDEGFNETNADRFALKTMSILRGGIDPENGNEINTTSIEQVKAAIDNAVANRAWLIFTLHQIDNIDTNVYGATPEFLQQMADYIAEKQAVVKTMSEAIRLMPGVPAKDTSAPTVATTTDVTVPAQNAEGAVVTFTAPAVTDNADNSLKPFCFSSGGLVSGSTFPVGITSVSCQAMDSSGNLSAARTFNVIVVDPAAPVITMSTTTSPTKLQQLTFAFSSSDPLAVLESKLDSASYATTTSPQTLTALSEGEHSFTVRATDSENRVGLAITNFVVDLTKPIISLIGSSTVNIAVGAEYTDSGATAIDSLDGIITGAIVKSGDTISSSTPAGTYRINYDVTDRAGNVADRVTKTVIVGIGGPVSNGVSDITFDSFNVTWTTAEPTYGWLAWDTISHTNASSTAAGPDKYAYANRTASSTLLTNHSVKLNGLSPNTSYYFRTVSLASSTATSTLPTISEEITAKTLVRPSTGGGYIPSTPLTYYGQAGFNGSINWNGNGVGGNPNGDFFAEAQMVIGYDGDIVLTAANTALLNNVLNGRVGVTGSQRKAIAYFIQEGTWGTRKLGAGERAGVVKSFARAFERLPQDADDWEDVLKIGSGRWTKKVNAKAEQNAIAIFSLIYRRSPNMSNPRDEMALKLIAYGLRPGNRNLNNERVSLRTFFSVFNRIPNQTGDWDIIRAIAYSGAKR